VISKINRKPTGKIKIIFVRWHYVALLINFQRGFSAQVRTISMELATHRSLLDCMKGSKSSCDRPNRCLVERLTGRFAVSGHVGALATSRIGVYAGVLAPLGLPAWGVLTG
jgi:hypothetical protein